MAEPAVQERLVTAEEFYELFGGLDFELVNGRVVDSRTGRGLAEWWYQVAARLGLPADGKRRDPVLPFQGLVSAERFWDIASRTDARLELVDGVVIELSPPGPQHGLLDSWLGARLRVFVEDHGLGQVFANTGFLLGSDPPLVRAPDQAFVTTARIAANPMPERGYWAVAPDLAVEVVSPDDTAGDIAGKVEDYLSAGVRLIWIVYPKKQSVHVYAPGAPVEIVAHEGTLNGRDVVPGFELLLSRMWGSPQ